VWLLLLIWPGIGLLRAKPHIPILDVASIALIWIVSTGLVTLGATLILIVPYICLMSPDKLLAMPWRMYLEPGIIAVFASLGLNYFIKPTASTYWQNLPPYLIFALVTSLASSFFFMNRLKAFTRQRSSPGDPP
jgi:hypothetical protein